MTLTEALSASRDILAQAGHVTLSRVDEARRIATS